MLEFRAAGPAEIIEAFRQVHAQWPHADKVDEHVAQRLASVQHKRATWFVGCLKGKVVCSLGAYPYHTFGPVGSCPARVFGAVYTVAEHRRQGYAAELLRSVIAHYGKQGVTEFALFSDIAPGYYEGLGFCMLSLIHI